MKEQIHGKGWTEILKRDAEEFSDLAALELAPLHPDAEVWIVMADERSPFRHVFLVIKGRALDLQGWSSVDAMVRKYSGETHGAFRSDWATLQRHSRTKRSKSEEIEKRQVFREYIQNHQERFA